MVVVACCCCIPYRLELMLAPTFAPCVLTFAPYILIFGPCACDVSLLSTGANIPLAQVVVVTSCNWRWWCFSIQPLAQILHLHTWWHHPLQLALVVLFHPSTGTNTALAPGQLALCGGGQWCYILFFPAKTFTNVGMVQRVIKNRVRAPTHHTGNKSPETRSPLPVWQSTTPAGHDSSPSRDCIHFTQVNILRLQDTLKPLSPSQNLATCAVKVACMCTH